MKIDPHAIRFSESSYVDPSGRLFLHDDRIFRGILPEAASFIDGLVQSDPFRKLQKQGKIVGTRRAEIEVPEFALVLEHERIPFPSYACEWAPPMLKDAGLLLLEILSEFVDRDILVADGHPWNILFDGPRPVFVDVGSFEPAEDAMIWPAYQQFCNLFLYPLYLCEAGLGRVARTLSLTGPEGVSSAECRSMLPLSFKIRRPRTWLRVLAPDFLSKLSTSTDFADRLREASQTLATKVDLKKTRKKFVGKLIKELSWLNPAPESTRWSRYYETEAPLEIQKKLEVVSEVLDRIQPASLFDAGCNTGAFSVQAAEKNIATVATDTDESCVSLLYARARSEGLQILPLIMNVMNQTPSSGWMGTEYPGAASRLECDCVLALSLIHHLAFTQLQDFSRIIKALDSFAARWLLIEYVEKDDVMAHMLYKRCRHPVEFYRMDRFVDALGEKFRRVEKAPVYSPTRTLFICEK